MSTYKIYIEKSMKVPERKKDYVGKGEVGADEYGYRYYEVEEEKMVEVYSQLTSKEIDLKAIIDAFNK